MKKPLKAFFAAIVILVLITAAAFAYLNFVYLPQKVKTAGAAYLEKKSKGQVKAESIRYIPFKGVELKKITILSKAREPILRIDKLYFNVNLWPLIIRRDLDFRLDLYPPGIKRPFVFKGLYRIKEQKLDLDFQVRNNLFLRSQTIYGKVKALVNREERSDIDLNITSQDLNLQGNFYIEGQDLRIEKFSGKALDSSFDFIGDVQNFPQPLLNIYGNLDLDLANLKKINPEYTGIANKLKLEGRCKAEVYITSKPDNPRVGLKMSAAQIKIDKTKLEDLSLVSKMENKMASLTKFYARSYGGEINLQANCRLDSKDFPANLNLNVFNLGLNEIIRDITGKDIPVHGRLFSLGRVSGYLKNPEACEGKVWLSASGSNILELPAFKGIADVLRLPELRRIEFKEASGNFTIAQQAIKTSDFKIAGNNIVIYFKGSMDFDGNLGFDIQPFFSRGFISSAPNIANILGIFVDSAGNFLGEIKMKGNIKEPRYTFKPISMEKLLPRGIEEGLKQLFKLKKE